MINEPYTKRGKYSTIVDRESMIVAPHPLRSSEKPWVIGVTSSCSHASFLQHMRWVVATPYGKSHLYAL